MNDTFPVNKRSRTCSSYPYSPAPLKISRKDVEAAFQYLHRNMDPCMQTKWRREPWPVRPLTVLDAYEVSEDTGEEQDSAILQRGLRTVDLKVKEKNLMSVISSVPVHKTIQIHTFPEKCVLGQDVREQCVWGIDCFTRKMLFDCLQLCPELMATDEGDETKRKEIRYHYIEKKVLPALNQLGDRGWDMITALELILHLHPEDEIMTTTTERLLQIIQCIELTTYTPKPLTLELKTRIHETTENFRGHPKGQGIICLRPEGIPQGTFVEEYLGELYTPWRWFERQDVIKKWNPDGYLPDFYNIQIERPKEDALGFGVIFVEAADCGNFASRLCHSCQPNCRMLSLCSEGRITNAIFTLRHVEYGEELTWDYSCVTESEKEYRAAICLCGMSSCRGSFLYYAHSSAFQEVMSKEHNFLIRNALLLHACHERLTERDRARLRRNGIKSYVLQLASEDSTLIPNWLMKWTALVLEFIEFEQQELPKALMADQEKYTEESAEIEAHGVSSNRLQNLVITIDKAKYFLRRQEHKDPPLKLLDDDEVLAFLWTGESSVMRQAVEVLKEHSSKLDRNAQAFHKSRSGDSRTPSHQISGAFEQTDQLTKVFKYCQEHQPRTPSEARRGIKHLARQLRLLSTVHLALHDILMLKATTRYFFKSTKYNGLISSTVRPSEVDVQADLANDYIGKRRIKGQPIVAKTYSPEFLWGQLIGWYKQSVYNPSSSLSAERRGSVSLPSLENCYSQPVLMGVYESAQRPQMIKLMERKPEAQWPTGKIWSFKNQEKVYGTPMLDVAIEKMKKIRGPGRALKRLLAELKTSPIYDEDEYDNEPVIS